MYTIWDLENLFRTLKNSHGSNGMKICQRYNKLMILKSKRKTGGVLSFGGKRSCLKRIRGYNTGKDEGGSRHSFAK